MNTNPLSVQFNTSYEYTRTRIYYILWLCDLTEIIHGRFVRKMKRASVVCGSIYSPNRDYTQSICGYTESGYRAEYTEHYYTQRVFGAARHTDRGPMPRASSSSSPPPPPPTFAPRSFSSHARGKL